MLSIHAGYQHFSPNVCVDLRSDTSEVVLPVKEELLTVDQVADHLKVRARTVRDWIRRNELPAIKIGREWRIEQTALEQFLDERRTHNK